MDGDEQLQQWSVAFKPIATPAGFGILKGPKGHLLVDSKRMTLYVSDADSPTHAACAGECARTWRPVEAWWLAVPSVADWTVIDRPDGTRQWAFRGRPLYRYASDFNPGEVGGGAVRGWHPVVLQPPPPIPAWITLQESDGGELYATAEGKTIYMHDLTRPRGFGIGFAREMESPETWDALLDGAADKPVGFFSIVTNAAGQRQWTYKGMLLYTHKLDREPGDLHGIRNFDRVWRTIMASGQTMPGTGN
jgi:predicted lipoprotein with Yx(FWY)xxD motif